MKKDLKGWNIYMYIYIYTLFASFIAASNSIEDYIKNSCTQFSGSVVGF